MRAQTAWAVLCFALPLTNFVPVGRLAAGTHFASPPIGFSEDAVEIRFTGPSPIEHIHKSEFDPYASDKKSMWKILCDGHVGNEAPYGRRIPIRRKGYSLNFSPTLWPAAVLPTRVLQRRIPCEVQ